MVLQEWTYLTVQIRYDVFIKLYVFNHHTAALIYHQRTGWIFLVRLAHAKVVDVPDNKSLGEWAGLCKIEARQTGQLLQSANLEPFRLQQGLSWKVATSRATDHWHPHPVSHQFPMSFPCFQMLPRTKMDFPERSWAPASWPWWTLERKVGSSCAQHMVTGRQLHLGRLRKASHGFTKWGFI